jgi:hypothetical protein
MNIEERKKLVKHRLIDRNLSFRAWCTSVGVSHSVARDFVSGRLTGTIITMQVALSNIVSNAPRASQASPILKM